MVDSDSSPDRLPVFCKICGIPSTFFGETNVLRKYAVQYFRCGGCEFIQTEEPYWLAESYSSAIAKQDVGIMRRNLANCQVTAAVLNLLLPNVSEAIDFGGGHGVFVRLMRDKGFNFYWSDLHATNDYARGFEGEEGATFDFLTAFEVLEHLTDPVADLSTMMSMSDNVFVSTCTVPQPVPKLSEWWYYAPTTGQHIAFYTRETLRVLAARFDRNLLSIGPYHLFTKEPKNNLLYRFANNPRISGVVNRLYRRPSLIESDFEEMTR